MTRGSTPSYSTLPTPSYSTLPTPSYSTLPTPSYSKLPTPSYSTLQHLLTLNYQHLLTLHYPNTPQAAHTLGFYKRWEQPGSGWGRLRSYGRWWSRRIVCLWRGGIPLKVVDKGRTLGLGWAQVLDGRWVKGPECMCVHVCAYACVRACVRVCAHDCTPLCVYVYEWVLNVLNALMLELKKSMCVCR